MTVYQIPLSAGVQQTLSVAFPSGTYQLRLIYSDAPNGNGGWILDVLTGTGTTLIAGIPLVSGADLLEQYAYLNIGVQLYIFTPGNPAAVPTYADLGVTTKLYYKTP